MSDHPMPPDLPAPPPPSGGSATEPPPRRVSTRVLTAIGLVVALVAGLLVFMFTRSGSPGGPDVALALDFHKGDVYSFDTAMDMDVTVSVASQSQQVHGDVSGPMSMRVVTTGPGDVATVTVSMGPLTASTNGQEQTIPATSVQMQIAPDGRVLSGGGLAGGITQSFGGGTGMPGSDQFTPFLPDHEVGPGDTWDTHVDRSLSAIGSGRMEFTADSTFLRYEDIHGAHAAVIQSEMTIPMNFTIDLAKVASRFGTGSGLPSVTEGTIVYRGSMDLTSTSWLDLSRKQVEKTDSAADMDVSFSLEGNSDAQIPGPIGMSGTMNMTFERTA